MSDQQASSKEMWKTDLFKSHRIKGPVRFVPPYGEKNLEAIHLVLGRLTVQPAYYFGGCTSQQSIHRFFGVPSSVWSQNNIFQSQQGIIKADGLLRQHIKAGTAKLSVLIAS